MLRSDTDAPSRAWRQARRSLGQVCFDCVNHDDRYSSMHRSVGPCAAPPRVRDGGNGDAGPRGFGLDAGARPVARTRQADRARDRQCTLSGHSAEQPGKRRARGGPYAARAGLRSDRARQSAGEEVSSGAARLCAAPAERERDRPAFLCRARRADRRAQLPAAGRHQPAGPGRDQGRGGRHRRPVRQQAGSGQLTRPDRDPGRLSRQPVQQEDAQHPGLGGLGRDGCARRDDRLLGRARSRGRGWPGGHEQRVHAASSARDA